MPRHCATIRIGADVGVMCGSGIRACTSCGELAAYLCDYPVRPPREGRKPGTCNAPICDRCRRQVGQNRDYCPAHAGGAQGRLPLLELVER